MVFDLDLLLRGIGVAVTLVLSIVQIVRTTRRPRAKLAADLEILEKLAALEPEGENHQRVQAQVTSWVERIYDPDKEPILWANIIIGLLLLLGFGTWTGFILVGGPHWSAFLTGYGALLGLTFLVSAVGPNRWSAFLERVGITLPVHPAETARRKAGAAERAGGSDGPRPDAS